MSIMSNYTPISIAYDVFEPTEKSNLPDVILLHGLTFSKESWNEIASKLAEGSGRKVYALDFRNHGDSSWNDVSFDFEAMAKDVRHFMDERDMKKIALVGHSMGGKISMMITLAQPERVEKIVVEEYSPKPLKGEKEINLTYTKLLQKSIQIVPADADLSTAKKMVMDFINSFKRKPKEPSTSRSSTQNSEYSSLPLVKREGKYVWKANMEIVKYIPTAKAKHVTLEGLYEEPALFIYGIDSPFNIPEYKDDILRAFPKATLHGIKDAGHLCHSDNPKDFLEAVLKFLNK